MILTWIGGEKFCEKCNKQQTIYIGNNGEWYCIECNTIITRISIAKAEGRE